MRADLGVDFAGIEIDEHYLTEAIARTREEVEREVAGARDSEAAVDSKSILTSDVASDPESRTLAFEWPSRVPSLGIPQRLEPDPPTELHLPPRPQVVARELLIRRLRARR